MDTDSLSLIVFAFIVPFAGIGAVGCYRMLNAITSRR